MDNKKTNQLLEEIRKLFILALAEQKIQGKRIAEVLDVDPAIISRILSLKKKNNKI